MVAVVVCQPVANTIYHRRRCRNPPICFLSSTLNDDDDDDDATRVSRSQSTREILRSVPTPYSGSFISDLLLIRNRPTQESE